MSFRSIGLGLLLTAAASAALAQGQQAPNNGQQPNGMQQPYGQQPYGTQPYGQQPYGSQNGQPAPYGVRPPPQPYVPPAAPLPVPPMNAPPAQQNPLFAQPIDPPGYGWCRFTDDNDKRTFYSAPFPGSPKHDLTPRDVAFNDYIHRAYPGFLGQVDCYWQPFDSAYDSQTTEEHNESGDQLRNYHMINTQWKPTPL